MIDKPREIATVALPDLIGLIIRPGLALHDIHIHKPLGDQADEFTDGGPALEGAAGD